ncbi:hypothetical protein BABINDRAFT_159445, partial [Babjeviella inositovora NRRL Y-12698]
MSLSLKALQFPAQSGIADSAIIFIHGLGDTSNGWSFFRQMALARSNPIYKNAKFIFPQAPDIPITANGGYVMPGWFDLFEFGNPNAKQDIQGFRTSVEKVRQLVLQTIESGIKPERIILGGFSQGAALSLACLPLINDVKLGGVVALSGFMTIKDSVHESVAKFGGNDKLVNRDTPIFQGHGTVDPLIAHQYGKMTSEIMIKEFGFKNLKFHSYSGVAHSAS